MSSVLTSAEWWSILLPVSYFYAEFGANLKRARERAELTQKELADRVLLPRTSVTNIEHGRQRIALHQLVQFAEALGVEPLELLPEDELNLDELVAETGGEALPADQEQRQFIASVLRGDRGLTKGGSGR
jgi:transcriptional regulator with XRE-family HTH domain